MKPILEVVFLISVCNDFYFFIFLVANKAFPIEQKVLEFMSEEFQCPINAFQQGLDPNMKYRLEKFIKGLKISYEMPNPGGQVQKRIYKVTGLGGSPVEERFVDETHFIVLIFFSLKNQILLSNI